MSEAQIADTAPDQQAFEDFSTTLRGSCIRPGDHDYDDARLVWNKGIDKRPAVIARCSGVADVMEAVSFARARNLVVAVRGRRGGFAQEAGR